MRNISVHKNFVRSLLFVHLYVCYAEKQWQQKEDFLSSRSSPDNIAALEKRQAFFQAYFNAMINYNYCLSLS